MERDNVGKITRELSYVEPQDGNNVKLTINAAYQQQAERALAINVETTRAAQEAKLMDNTWLEANRTDIESRNWEKYPLSLADRAAMMVIDMDGRCTGHGQLSDLRPERVDRRRGRKRRNPHRYAQCFNELTTSTPAPRLVPFSRWSRLWAR